MGRLPSACTVGSCISGIRANTFAGMGVPSLGQNLIRFVITLPQFGHRGIFAPHFAQNFELSCISCPHFGHIISDRTRFHYSYNTAWRQFCHLLLGMRVLSCTRYLVNQFDCHKRHKKRSLVAFPRRSDCIFSRWADRYPVAVAALRHIHGRTAHSVK